MLLLPVGLVCSGLLLHTCMGAAVQHEGARPANHSCSLQPPGTGCTGNSSGGNTPPPPARDTFAAMFGSKYPADGQLPEERYRIFLESLQRQKNLNHFAHGSGALYGINQFSDLTPKEFSNIFLKSYPALEANYIVLNETSLGEDSLPLRFDWRDKNMVTKVKNQLDCGACWAFSIVDTVESAYAIKGHPITELSVQQVIDCSYMDNGCNGGSTLSALKWLYQTQTKLVRSSEYPFKARTGACHYLPGAEYGVSIHEYKAYDMSKNEEVMMKLLIDYGPLAVIVDALSWQDYLGGIIQHHCTSRQSNHAVVLVGYDKSGDIPYWIVKNSWSSTWGINGYVHIKMGDNLCGIADFVTFPIM